MNQHEFVESCLIKYRYEPPPPGQEWEEAHYPKPKCLGGTATIGLWSCDHTVQGILQSEEYNHPCIHGAWREHDTNNLRSYYPQMMGRYEEVYTLLKKAGGKAGGPVSGQKCYEEGLGIFSLSEDEKRSVAVQAGIKAGRESYENKTGLFGLSEEERREANKKGAAVISSTNGRNSMSQKWQCLVTGYVSNPGGLTSYQRARGIDTTLRVRIQD
jgi:hypothetical protein